MEGYYVAKWPHNNFRVPKSEVAFRPTNLKFALWSEMKMNHKEVGRYWDKNAEVWTRLSRAGYDVYRDYLNTPAFFKMLPDVTNCLVTFKSVYMV